MKIIHKAVLASIIVTTIVFTPAFIFAYQYERECYDYGVSSGAGNICERLETVLLKIDTVIKNQEILKLQNAQLIKLQIEQNKLLEIQNCIAIWRYGYNYGDYGFGGDTKNQPLQTPLKLAEKCGVNKP